MKKCSTCSNEIDDKYIFCFECSTKNKQNSAMNPETKKDSIETHLKHINWNLGKLVAILSKDAKTLNKIDKAIKDETKHTTR